MKTKVKIRYISGREEEFELELIGGTSAEDRLKKFAKDPTIVLQTEGEVVIIPSTAIERITLPLPEEISLSNVRKAKRPE